MDLLVTGATGYVGGRLVPRLLAEGHRVRCLARRPDVLDDAPWRADVEVIDGTAEDEGAVLRAADGADAAYFLVHAMAGRLGGLVERERRIAAGFRDGVDAAGVRRVVYLGGLVDEEGLARTSTHLYAREQAGQELRAGRVPVTELRAGIVVGAGSASFQLARAAARSRLDLRTSWTASPTQPIAETDLLDLLVAVVDDPRAAWQVLEVGGPDVVTYRAFVSRIRELAGDGAALPLPLPYLPTEVAATAAATVTRMDPALVVPLLSSAAVPAVVRDGRVRELYPRLAGTDLDTAITRALAEG
ncbi:NAD(P)H-binding protein [Nitriliruptoraceae bacterium ZYF776]|nr:NAD(P)H-binding protein [Profundirhabdus halotolerans]